jgi:hypothetical protein
MLSEGCSGCIKIVRDVEARRKEEFRIIHSHQEKESEKKNNI